jgi:hypothetical protein
MSDRRQLTAWAGMIGPALFVGAFTFAGWLRPGYDPLREYVSALSIGPLGWIQIANFVVVGVLLFLFARGVAIEFRHGPASKAGPLLLEIIAGSLLLSGPFVMDPATTPPGGVSLHGTLHGIFGALVFSLMPINCFVFVRRFREERQWRTFQPWTLAAGTIIAAAVVLLTIATKVPAATRVFTAWRGVIQRAALIPYMCWLFVFAMRLRKQLSETGG